MGLLGTTNALRPVIRFTLVEESSALLLAAPCPYTLIVYSFACAPTITGSAIIIEPRIPLNLKEN